jgi:hypothetical protein
MDYAVIVGKGPAAGQRLSVGASPVDDDAERIPSDETH